MLAFLDFVLNFCIFLICDPWYNIEKKGRPMKCFVGYQPCRTDAFLNRILENREKIAEVYFPWGAMHSGRSAMGLEQDRTP